MEQQKASQPSLHWNIYSQYGWEVFFFNIFSAVYAEQRGGHMMEPGDRGYGAPGKFSKARCSAIVFVTVYLLTVSSWNCHAWHCPVTDTFPALRPCRNVIAKAHSD